MYRIIRSTLNSGGKLHVTLWWLNLVINVQFICVLNRGVWSGQILRGCSQTWLQENRIYCIHQKGLSLNVLISAKYLIICVLMWQHYHYQPYLQLMNYCEVFVLPLIYCSPKPSYLWLLALEAFSVNLQAVNKGDDDKWCTVTEGIFLFSLFQRSSIHVRAGCQLQRNHIFGVLPCFH